MVSVIRCCKDCIKRKPACHSNCEEYQKEKLKSEEVKTKIRKSKQADSALYACTKWRNHNGQI